MWCDFFLNRNLVKKSEFIFIIYRSRCAAVMMGNTIVVFGGPDKTGEYLVLGESTWRKLPPMHYEREGAIACVLP